MAQPRKPMKSPLPSLPGAPPALPPRRLPAPPIGTEEDYDEFVVGEDSGSEQEEEDIDEHDKPHLPAFRPPPRPALPDPEAGEMYDEFEVEASQPSVSPPGPGVYELDNDEAPIQAPVPPPLPPSSKRPLPQVPKQDEGGDEYVIADCDDEHDSGGSHMSSGSEGPPPLPSMGIRNKMPELPTRVEKKKHIANTGGPLIDINKISSAINRLKPVSKSKPENKSKEKENDKLMFGKPLKPVIPGKPNSNGIVNISSSNQTGKIHATEIKPVVHTEIESSKDTEDVQDKQYDDQELYDDAESLVQDPFSIFPWYHKEINREESNKRIHSLAEDGTYLVRKSKKDANHPYTLVVLFDGKIHNLKIRSRSDKRYALGEDKEDEVTFATVPEVISHHQKNDVILIGSKKGNVKLKKSPLKY